MSKIDRRSVLGAAATGAGLVWVAPSLLSVDAAMAQTAAPLPDFQDAFGDEGNPGAPGIDVTIPPGRLLDGDLLIAVGGIRFSNSKDAGIQPPVGFTPVVPATSPPPLTPGGITSQTTPIPTSEALRAYVWSKVWNTGDPLIYNFEKTLATGMPTRWSAGILVFRGTSGIGAADGQGQVSTTVTAPSITTAGPNRVVVFIGVTSGPTTWTGPAGFTIQGQGPTNSGNPQGLLGNIVQVVAGPTGPATATFLTPADPAVDDNVGFLLELLP